MKARTAFFALLLAATALRAESSLSPTAQAQAQSPSAESAADFVAKGMGPLVGELAMLDGGPLSQALQLAAQQGRSVRLVLDPTELSTRQQGLALAALKPAALSASPTAQALSPTVELRWLEGAGRGQRRLLEGAKLLKWRAGQAPQRDDAGAEAFQHRFEKRWPEGAAELPEGQRLDDELKSLPDPRENTPRITRRKEIGGE